MNQQDMQQVEQPEKEWEDVPLVGKEVKRVEEGKLGKDKRK